MFYCPGEFCSKKNECLHHQLKNSTRNLQLLDMSTEGLGWGGIDENGNHFHHHKYCCGDRASKYSSLWRCETWQDKYDFENAYNPAHAEGIPVSPGSLILIENDKGEAEIVPFHPKTLKLTTKVLNWRPRFED